VANPIQITPPTKDTVIGKFISLSEQDIFQIVGPGGKILASLNSKGLFNPTFVPIVQNSLLVVNTSSPQSVSNIAVANSLYNIAVNMESRGNGAQGSTVVTTIAWVPVQGGVKNVTLVLSGEGDQIQQENYVLLAAAGTNITVSTGFSSTPFNYDIAVAIAILPTAGG
jgi:hypothetical protein